MVVSEQDLGLAGDAITDFGFDLFAAARAERPDANLTVSPASVLAALTLVEPGAVGAARQQLRQLLRMTDPDRFHPSVSALAVDLEARPAGEAGPGDPGELTARFVNAAYLQMDYPFAEEYVKAINDGHGSALHQVDFRADPAGVTADINRFVAEVTNDLIPNLIPDGVIDRDTALTLINALYLKASWEQPFPESATVDGRFTTVDGTATAVRMMRGGASSGASGDGWIGATKNYAGQLAAQFILPDAGRFEEVAGDLGSVIGRYHMDMVADARLELPQFTLRANLELSLVLQRLGLAALFSSGGLMGIAGDPDLVVDKVIHETVVTMDEAGTEAAAATAVLMTRTMVVKQLPVRLDRPFLYRIFDRHSGATLFLGQVTRP